MTKTMTKAKTQPQAVIVMFKPVRKMARSTNVHAFGCANTCEANCKFLCGGGDARVNGTNIGINDAQARNY
jgi:hypothetical protein